MLWLALTFPQLQLDSLAAVEEAKEGSIARVIIDKQQKIIQKNVLAADSGIQAGMKLGTAAALADPLTVHVYEESFELQRLQELAQACYEHSADIALISSDTLVFEVSSMLQLYGDFPTYWQALSEVIASQSLTVQGAIAPSVLAAREIARSTGPNSNMTSQFEGRDSWLSALKRLSIAQLDIPFATQKQLEHLGLKRVEQLHELCQHTQARKELGVRLGRELLLYLDRLFGEVAYPLNYFRPPEQFTCSILLDHEIQSSVSLLFPLKRLLQALQTYLQSRTKRVQKLCLSLQQRDGREQRVDSSSAEPLRDSQSWLSLMQLRLERVELEAPVLGLRLEASDLLEETQQTQDLFEPVAGLAPEQLVSRLQAGLGESSVRRFQVQEDHRPEYAFSEQCALKQAEKPNVCDCSLSVRPSLFLDSPQPLLENIQLIHGPERIQSAWWTDQVICRDYFVARNLDQQTLWVFRDEQQQWYVHGLFA